MSVMKSARGERTQVAGLAILIVATLGVYVLVRSSPGSASDESGRLLPYQALARTLPDADQQVFGQLHSAVLVAESERAQSGAWPDPARLAAASAEAFTSSASRTYRWHQTRRGVVTDYLAVPAEPSDPAWLVKIQEPEPGALPDPAPNDEEHHRLPDGTTLHLYIWTHRIGGRVPVEFVPSPQSSGWTQVLYAPPNPVAPTRS